MDSHSSSHAITHAIKQPTRSRRGSRLYGTLFGLALGGVYLANECYHRCGALLPHPFTLTKLGLAVSSLLHLPSAHAAQTLSGTLPYRARTFLPLQKQAATAWLTPEREINDIEQ